MTINKIENKVEKLKKKWTKPHLSDFKINNTDAAQDTADDSLGLSS